MSIAKLRHCNNNKANFYCYQGLYYILNALFSFVLDNISIIFMNKSKLQYCLYYQKGPSAAFTTKIGPP